MVAPGLNGSESPTANSLLDLSWRLALSSFWLRGPWRPPQGFREGSQLLRSHHVLVRAFPWRRRCRVPWRHPSLRRVDRAGFVFCGFEWRPARGQLLDGCLARHASGSSLCLTGVELSLFGVVGVEGGLLLREDEVMWLGVMPGDIGLDRVKRTLLCLAPRDVRGRVGSGERRGADPGQTQRHHQRAQQRQQRQQHAPTDTRRHTHHGIPHPKVVTASAESSIQLFAV